MWETWAKIEVNLRNSVLKLLLIGDRVDGVRNAGRGVIKPLRMCILTCGVLLESARMPEWLYYYPSLYMSLQCMEMVLGVVTSGSKGSEWETGCGALSLPPPLPGSHCWWPRISLHVLYTSCYPSWTTKSQTQPLSCHGSAKPVNMMCQTQISKKLGLNAKLLIG